MVDVILRYLDYGVMRTQLAGLGITVQQNEDELIIESQFGAVNTPLLDTHTGKAFLIRMTDADAELLAGYLDPPNFVCDWRSDEGEEAEEGGIVLFDKKLYDCNGVDPDTLEPLVVQRLVGTIA